MRCRSAWADTLILSAVLTLWWVPALVLAIGGYVMRAAGVEVRLRRVDRLLAARRVDVAGRVLRQLRFEVEGPRRRLFRRDQEAVRGMPRQEQTVPRAAP